MTSRSMAITGASSGLGYKLAVEMARAGWTVWNLSPTEHPIGEENIKHIPCDVRVLGEPALAAQFIREKDPNNGIQILVNNAAINKIAYLEDVTPEEWAEVMDTNARGIFYTTRAFLSQLKESAGTVLNVVSDAAHRPMTGSLAYNASKGAAYIMTLQLARELTRRYGICVFGIAPGKMADTGMSDYIDVAVCEMRGWTPEEAEKYAQAGRLWPEAINTDILASFLGYILSSPLRHRYFSGCVIPYGA